MAEFRYYNDEQIIRQQLGLHEEESIPDCVLPEYDKRLSMMHRAGVTGQLRAGEIMNMLRFLNIEPKREVRKLEDKPADWCDVEAGTKVIVKCPDRGYLKGTLKRAHHSTLSIDIPSQDPRVQAFLIKDVRLDIGQLEAIADSAKRDDPQWQDVPMGTPIVATDEHGTIVNGMLAELGPGPEKLTLLLENSNADLCFVLRKDAAVYSEAVAATTI